MDHIIGKSNPAIFSYHQVAFNYNWCMYLGVLLCGLYQFAERNVKLESIKRNRQGKYPFFTCQLGFPWYVCE